jgi:hypothetical protein
MNPLDIFLNRHGRLRSGWRLAIFCAAYYAVLAAFFIALYGIFHLLKFPNPNARLAGTLGYLVQAFVLLTAALVVGWGCGRLFEDLPLRALGWARHRGWLRDLLIGSLSARCRSCSPRSSRRRFAASASASRRRFQASRS